MVLPVLLRFGEEGCRGGVKGRSEVPRMVELAFCVSVPPASSIPMSFLKMPGGRSSGVASVCSMFRK